MPLAKVSDINMYYEVCGEGPPVLLTAGWVLAGRAFSRMVPTLSESYTCIRHDHRNMGRSDAPDGPTSMAQMADDLAGLLDHLKIDKLRVFGGGGMGAVVALQLASRHPDRVLSLHLGSPCLRPDSLFREIMEIWRQIRRYDVALWARDVEMWSFAPQTLYERFELYSRAAEARAAENTFPAPGAYDRIVDAYLAFDATEAVKKIRSPTLITSGGERDLVTGPQFTEEVHKAIPGSEYRVISGGGHAYPAEFPEAYLEIALEWLARHS